MICFFEKGKSDYVILHGADVCEKFAAEELQRFIEESTGVTLPIVEKAYNKPYISVGQTEEWARSGIKQEWKKNTCDGIRLAEKDCNIYLVGKRVRSTLYATYDFLETYFGVRFFAPDCTRVPKRYDVLIENLDKTEEPSFDIRSYYNVQMEKDSLYTARLRQVSLYCEEKAEYGFGLEQEGQVQPHTILKYLPYDVYYPTHPEYFSSCELPHSKKIEWDICWSQGVDEKGELIKGGSADIVADNVIKDIEAKPNGIWFSITQCDKPQGCQCEKCKNNLKRFGTYSGIIINYVNAVARKVENWRKEHCANREVRLVTFAYDYSLDAPIDEKGNVLIKPEKNLWIWLATAEQNMFYSCGEKGQHPTYTKNIEKWKKVTNRFCYWDYRFNTVENLFYFPGLSIFKSDFQYFEDMGISYLFTQATTGSLDAPDMALHALKGYVAAKLMWNTSLEVKPLIGEFCDEYFGTGAESVVQMIEDFENNYRQVRETNPNARMHLALGYRTLEEDYYPKEMLEKAINSLTKAIAECKEETYKKRLLNVLCTPQRMLLRNYANYYPKDIEGKEKLYRELLVNLEKCNFFILGCAEFTLDNLKKYPDYNYYKMNNIPY